MKDKKHIEPMHCIEKIMNAGSYLNQLDDELCMKLENNKYLKDDILTNLIIANEMIDKYGDIIFNDVDLRERSKQLFKRLSNLLI